MAFIVDKQTLDDLNIFGKRGKNSIYGMFNVTRTLGGAHVLEQMFFCPLSDVSEINRRNNIIRYFKEYQITFPFQGELFDILEHYLLNKDNRSRLAAENNTLQRKLKGAIGADTEYIQLYKGILAAIEIVCSLRDFIQGLQIERDNVYWEELDGIRQLVLLPDFDPVIAVKGKKKLSYEVVVQLDTLLRFSLREKLFKLLGWVYYLDVYISVAQVATERGFVFAEAHSGGNEVLSVTGMYHPAIPNAVANSLVVDRSNNVLFLTGANMAGKSTFMKTLGTIVFLAHMGFPVPAERMTFSVLEGMYTTINLPDNLNMGYSHFYADVLRVKKVATQLSSSKKLLVIFDELFRGTNVKDAYDATVAITKAFAQKRECLFVISTHIVEAGEVLQKVCSNVNFVYFPTLMEGSKPHYTYKLVRGITSDRHGMVIIKNEKVIELLRESKQKDFVRENKFSVDKQTLDDLNLLGEFRQNSIFMIFNKTRTRGGKRLLESMFRYPLVDAQAINERASIFCFFQRSMLDFPIDDDLFQVVDHYFSTAVYSSFGVSFLSMGRRRFLGYIGADKEYETIFEELQSVVAFLKQMRMFVDKLWGGDIPVVYRPILEQALNLLHHEKLEWVFNERCQEITSWRQLAYRDYCLRGMFREEFRSFMEFIFGIDVYLSVASVAREKGFSYATALPFDAKNNHIFMKGVYHPAINGAVANTIELDNNRNVLFLTGANMAGKSTLMKSFSIAVYLAHMGFPVAVEKMEFSVQDGLYTSINVSDNLNMGYSHYYAEVLRVKHIAEEVSCGKNLVVIFDELFKGTNVKDAHDATVAVTEAFSENRNCTFVISTHIIEAGHDLRKHLDNLYFVFVPTIMQGNVPMYTYRLKEGITDDRHGMVIINNEHILDMLS